MGKDQVFAREQGHASFRVPPANALMMFRIWLTFLWHRLPRRSSKKPCLCVGSACPSQHGADLVSLSASAKHGVRLFGRTWEEQAESART